MMFGSRDLVFATEDLAVRRHLAVALTAHADRLRRDGVALPPALLELRRALEDELARSRPVSRGQARPTVALPAPPTDADDMNLAVTFAEAGRRLSVSERTVRRLVCRGDLEAVSVGGARRIGVVELRRFLAEGSGRGGLVVSSGATAPAPDGTIGEARR